MDAGGATNMEVDPEADDGVGVLLGGAFGFFGFLGVGGGRTAMGFNGADGGGIGSGVWLGRADFGGSASLSSSSCSCGPSEAAFFP